MCGHIRGVMQPEFESVFVRQRTILQKEEGTLSVKHNTPDHYSLEGSAGYRWLQEGWVYFDRITDYAFPRLNERPRTRTRTRTRRSVRARAPHDAARTAEAVRLSFKSAHLSTSTVRVKVSNRPCAGMFA